MIGGLALAFIVVTLAEAWLFVEVGGAIGFLPTFALVLVVSVVGAWLVKREGVGVWRRAQAQMRAAKVPGKELADGALILVGGALLLTPGFLTDILGICLLVPPTRAVLRGVVLRYLAKRTKVRISKLGARAATAHDLQDTYEVFDAAARERDVR